MLFSFGNWVLVSSKSIEKKTYKLFDFNSLHNSVWKFLVYWLVYFYSNVIAKKPFPLFDDYKLINQTLLIIFLLIIFIGQPVYFVNLLIGIFRKRLAIH